MQTLPNHSNPCPANRAPRSGRSRGARLKSLSILLFAATMALSACGGGSSSTSLPPVSLSGNWQFTVAAPADGSFLGGLQGGFLQQSSGTVTGNVAYSVLLPPAQVGGNPNVCSSGSAVVTGTVTGQAVMLTAVAGTQTFTLSGTLSFDGSTMVGTYTVTAPNGSPCQPVSETGQQFQWSAIFVPPLTGPIQGSFHSMGGPAALNEQSFVLAGAISQAANAGASSANVTGNLSFVTQPSNATDYPCIANAGFTGQISGNTVTLQLTGSDSSNIGQIGAAGGTSLPIVTYDNAQGGYILHSLGAPAYAVYAAACGGGTVQNPADFGNICLAVNNTKDCVEPITLTPSTVTFPAQKAGTTTTQTIMLASTTNSVLTGLSLTLTNNTGPGNYAETDNCGANGAPSGGQLFDLVPLQPCTIKISFTPQCSTQCTSTIKATLLLNDPANTTLYTVFIKGTGISDSAAATPGLDFGSKDILEAALQRPLSFTKRRVLSN